MAFQEKLIRNRKRLGFSQEQLGHLVGVSRQTVSKWELGETTPEMEKLIQLSRLFNCSIDQLVENCCSSPEQSSTAPELSQATLWHYEYRSQHTLFGLPLVHINLGYGFCTAKGIFALGNYARGVFALGGTSIGVFALGGLSCGLFSLGGFSVGLIFAFGGVSLGTIAIGGLALGIFAIGGCAVGVYSMGGVAIAGKIAAGGYARGPIAVGERAYGQTVLRIREGFTPQELRAAILARFPGTWKVILDLFCNFE